MYGYLRKTFAVILILFSFLALMEGETYHNKLSFHTQIYNRLQSDRYSPVRQPLSSSNSTLFPYNVIIPSSDPESSLSVIFDSTFAINNINLIEDLSNYAEIAITVNDSSYLPKEIAINMPAGIRTYISSLQFPEERAVLILTTDTNLTENKCVIIPGASGKLTPYSFFKNTIDSLQTEGIPFSLKNEFLSLYRLNVTEVSPKLDFCLKEGCLAIELEFSPEIKSSYLATFIETLAKEYKETELDRNINYTFFRLGLNNIIIPEIFNTVVLVLITGVILFFICGLSFAFGKKKEQHRTEFIKYWLLIPIAVIMFIILFYAAQFASLKIIANWEQYPLFSIIFKILLSCCFFRIFSLLRHVIKIPCTDFIYGYLLTITCFINIYVFSAIDLSLFFPFSLACIIAYISRMTKKTSLLIFFLLLIITPVIMYGVTSLRYIQEEKLILLFKSSLALNTLFSIMILPFTFMIVRISVSTGLPGRLPGRKKRIIVESIITVSITLVLILTTAITTRALRKEVKEEKTIIEESSGLVLTSLRQSEKKDRTDFELVISSSLPAIRYDISAESETAMPFLYTNFPYQYDSVNDNIIFTLDENPPSPLVLTGSVSSTSTINFTVSSYMHNDQQLFKETKDIVLTTKGQ